MEFGNVHKVNSKALPHFVNIKPKLLYTGLVDGIIPIGVIELSNGRFAAFDARNPILVFGETKHEALSKLLEPYDC